MIKRIVKYLIGTIIVLIFVAFLAFQWIMYWNPTARRAWQNVDNSKKLKIGMTRKDLILIMGEPKSKGTNEYTEGYRIGDSVYYYQPPFAASSGIDIVIKNDSIKKIHYYEGN